MSAFKFSWVIWIATKSSSNGRDHVEDAGPQLEGDAGDDRSVVVKVENGNVAMKPLGGLKKNILVPTEWTLTSWEWFSLSIFLNKK